MATIINFKICTRNNEKVHLDEIDGLTIGEASYSSLDRPFITEKKVGEVRITSSKGFFRFDLSDIRSLSFEILNEECSVVMLSHVCAISEEESLEDAKKHD